MKNKAFAHCFQCMLLWYQYHTISEKQCIRSLFSVYAPVIPVSYNIWKTRHLLTVFSVCSCDTSIIQYLKNNAFTHCFQCMLLWYQYHTISDQVSADTWKRMKGKSLDQACSHTHTCTVTHTHTHTCIKKHKPTQTWKDVSDNGMQAVAEHNLVLQVIFRLVEVIVVLNNGLRDLNTRTANQELQSYWWWRRLSVCN